MWECTVCGPGPCERHELPSHRHVLNHAVEAARDVGPQVEADVLHPRVQVDHGGQQAARVERFREHVVVLE